MVGWVFDRLRDVLRREAAKHPPKPKKSLKTWRDYRGTGVTEFMHSMGRWDDARALFTILSGAVTADNDTDPKESETLKAILVRSRTFRRLSRNALEEVVDAAGKDLAENRIKAIEKATRSFAVSEERRASAYLHSVDILFADQALLPSEKEYAIELAAMLSIDASKVLDYDALMRAKNWSGSEMSSKQDIEELHRAFYTILAAAVLIDGEERPDEVEELKALMMRTRTLSHFKEAARAELSEEVSRRLKGNFGADKTRYDRIDLACEHLMSLHSKGGAFADIHLSAYLHAVDLVHADRALVTSEKDYLKHLEGKLGIGSAYSANAMLLLDQKNKY